MSWFDGLFKPMPFLDAIRAGKAGDVQKHLKAGVDPNRKTDGERAWPLHYAVHARPEMVALLIRSGAKVNVKDDGGKTPLHLAALSGYVGVVKLLVEAGAELNATDKFGHTPLFDAAADVSPYEMIYSATGATPSQRALQEQSGRGAVIGLLKSRGAVS